MLEDQLFQQRYYLYENLLGWNLYNEVLGLTNYFFLETGSSNGGVKTFDVTVRKLYTLHGG